MKSKIKKTMLSIVAIIAVALLIALTPSSIESHTKEKIVQADRETVWKVISDVGEYEKFATGLHDVTILSGEGKGMIRACSDPNGSWQEVCTSWDPGKSYTFEVDVNSDDYPYPFKVLIGTWSVEEISLTQSKIIVTFQFKFGQRWMSWMFSEATHEVFEKGDLLDNWEKEIIRVVQLEGIHD
jgi:ribosome-associated toxin RatA of RatAB toxin-antitoxin module